MIHRDVWHNAVLYHAVHHIPVQRDRLLVDFPCPFRDDARPAQGETVCLHAEQPHHCNVFPVSVNMVARHIRILVVPYPAFTGKYVPDALSCAVLCIPSLYLIGAACHAPHKIISKHTFSLYSFLIRYINFLR